MFSMTWKDQGSGRAVLVDSNDEVYARVTTDTLGDSCYILYAEDDGYEMYHSNYDYSFEGAKLQAEKAWGI